MKKWGILIFPVIFAAACAGQPPVEREAAEILALLSSGNAEALRQASRSPFLFDSEILQGEAMERLLWEGISRQGFALSGLRALSIARINGETPALFGGGYEVRQFFAKYLNPRDHLVHFIADQGEGCLILSSGKPRLILAWTWTGGALL